MQIDGGTDVRGPRSICPRLRRASAIGIGCHFTGAIRGRDTAANHGFLAFGATLNDQSEH